MKKLVLSAGCGGLLAIVAMASPARGQSPPPPPPPPNGGTPLATIGLPCPPTGCPTNTPTVTPSPTATLTPTATTIPTATPVPLFVLIHVAHSKVKVGQKQKVTVTTLVGASLKIVLVFPNKSKTTHRATANDSGRAIWTFKQPKNKTTSKSRSVKVTVRAATADASLTRHKKYTIR